MTPLSKNITLKNLLAIRANSYMSTTPIMKPRVYSQLEVDALILERLENEAYRYTRKKWAERRRNRPRILPNDIESALARVERLKEQKYPTKMTAQEFFKKIGQAK